MESKPSFRLELEQIQDYEFQVNFDLEDLPPMIVDEPAPLGRTRGPNPTRLLGIAVANCLASSLLFCLRKARLEPTKITSIVTATTERNEQKRLRIGGMNVTIDVEGISDPGGRFARCAEIFEDFCVVTATIRQGMTVAVAVSLNGEVVYSAV